MTRLSPLVLASILACQPQTDATPRAVASRTVALAPVVDGHNAFALDLLRAVNTEPEENLFFSPFSVTSALGMTYAGAAGATSAQMASAMHISAEAPVFHAQWGALTQDLDGDFGRPYTLHAANLLFPDTLFSVKDAFLTQVTTAYGAPVQRLNFHEDPEAARVEINRQVGEETSGLIEELIHEGQITDDTELVLVNAVYFKAFWQTQFDPQLTTDGTFHTPSGDVTVPMMQGEITASLAQNDLGTLVSIPYESGEVSFVAILPDDTDGLPQLIQELSVPVLDEWIDSAWESEQTVFLPSFTTRSALSLNDALKRLGMIDAFDPETADFSGISDTRVCVSNVVHEAVVIVDEEGTEAAAATGVIMEGTAVAEPVVLDRPFLFLIRDNLTGALLFVGQLNQPQ